MATSSPKFMWCPCHKHKIPSKDTHERCLHCLGIQHAKEAVLEYGKCPHCAMMDWSTCINRLTKVQELLHRENQQKKCQAAQSASKADTTPATLSESKTMKEPGPVLPHLAPLPATTVQSSTLPVMLTILSPPTSQADSNPTVQKGAHVSPLANQQSADLPLPLGQPSTLAGTHRSHKRKHSTCHSRRSKYSKRSRRRCRRRSPSSSSSSSSSFSSSCWSSSDASFQEGRSRKAPRTESKVRRLLGMVQQKLEAQQQAAEAQWTLLEKRIEALETRASEPTPLLPIATPSQTPQSVSESPPTIEGQRDEPEERHNVRAVGPTMEPILHAVVKQEEEPASISTGWKAEGPTGDAGASHLPEEPISRQDVLAAAELQALIARAAKYLSIEFPGTLANPTSPCPTMVPEFESLVQSTWSNPASSRPFRELFCKMYRLHENQAPAYDRMPQVGRFMAAIFQAVEPTENREATPPAKGWSFTETQAESMYQTAGMLVRTANYLRYLSDYQKHLLQEVSEDAPSERLVTILNELKLIGQFAFQLSSHQAELSGRVMAGSVAIRRQVWMAKTNYTDSLKATVADLPYVVCQTVEVGTGTTSTEDRCKQEVPCAPQNT
ncbi:putative POM121-like protein 1-like [Brienomyrus brachyistius]|uniref:putative POM121-like protein 1-like n=1 Tax=Brienomyrus brachyistius TaxID=42636 RepID=UPI0020B2189D|nr:putative POM121-like protein 1-like [Brienomyrus brachyistius]